MSEKILAWHWVAADGLTRFEPRVPVLVGEELVVSPPLELCSRGLHASERILDALQYAPGPILCRVELSGKILNGDDKLCAEKRRVIAMADATNILHEMACRSAESVYHLIPEAQRHIAKKAIDTKRLWMQGKASDSELDAAWAAAWDAARAAARAAAWAAAWAAARDAARDAAWAAARDAAWDAAWDAARDAAWDAQNKTLTTLALDLLKLEAA